MGQYLKIDSEPELKLQKVEDLMRELGITIGSYGGNGMTVAFEGIDGEFWIQSKETGYKTASFPRFFDHGGKNAPI